MTLRFEIKHSDLGQKPLIWDFRFFVIHIYSQRSHILKLLFMLALCEFYTMVHLSMVADVWTCCKYQSPCREHALKNAQQILSMLHVIAHGCWVTTFLHEIWFVQTGQNGEMMGIYDTQWKPTQHPWWIWTKWQEK